MHNSDAVRRENAKSYSVVIPRCAIAHLRARSASPESIGRPAEQVEKWIPGLPSGASRNDERRGFARASKYDYGTAV